MIKSLTLTAGGAQAWMSPANIPITCPVDVNDPRINLALLPLGGLQFGAGKSLQLGTTSMDKVVKRGWEPYAWHWEASFSLTARIFVYSTVNGILDPGDPILRPDPPLELGINVDRSLPSVRALPKPQPDFTLVPNPRPSWIATTSGSFAVPGESSEWKAKGFLQGGVYPIASNLITGDQFGAIMFVESTLRVALLSPYLIAKDGNFYCFVSIDVNSEAFPAASVFTAPGGELEYVPLPGDGWIFQDFDANSQELVGGSATSTQIPAPNELPQVGSVVVVDDTIGPSDVWGSVPMYAQSGFTWLGCSLRCLQHYSA